jgi:hypothetical protein
MTRCHVKRHILICTLVGIFIRYVHSLVFESGLLFLYIRIFALCLNIIARITVVEGSHATLCPATSGGRLF